MVGLSIPKFNTGLLLVRVELSARELRKGLKSCPFVASMRIRVKTHDALGNGESIVVPCGDGQITVTLLRVDQATH